MILGPRFDIRSSKDTCQRSIGVYISRILYTNSVAINSSRGWIQKCVVECWIKAKDVRDLMNGCGSDRLEEPIRQWRLLIDQLKCVEYYPPHRRPPHLQSVIQRWTGHIITRLSSGCICDIAISDIPRKNDQLSIGYLSACIRGREVETIIGYRHKGEPRRLQSFLIEVLCNVQRLQNEVQIRYRGRRGAVHPSSYGRDGKWDRIEVDSKSSIQTGRRRLQQTTFHVSSWRVLGNLRNIIVRMRGKVLIELVKQASIGMLVREGSDY